MKKLLLLLLCLVFVLCSCVQVPVEELEIPFSEIAKNNIREGVLNNYGCVSEKTIFTELGIYWVMYFEKDGENYNAIVDWSEDTRDYYYNGQIFTESNEGNISKVLPYREDYNKSILSMMNRNDELNYAYISEQSAEVDSEGNYIVNYRFAVNQYIEKMFENLNASLNASISDENDAKEIDIKLGDEMEICYTLDKDYRILKYEYYKIDGENKKKIVETIVTYNEKREFPQKIVDMTTKNKDFVNVTIYEDYNTAAHRSEVFSVEKGGYIYPNGILYNNYDCFKDPVYTERFDYETESINEDTNLYIIKYGLILTDEDYDMIEEMYDIEIPDEQRMIYDPYGTRNTETTEDVVSGDDESDEEINPAA